MSTIAWGASYHSRSAGIAKRHTVRDPWTMTLAAPICLSCGVPPQVQYVTAWKFLNGGAPEESRVRWTGVITSFSIFSVVLQKCVVLASEEGGGLLGLDPTSQIQSQKTRVKMIKTSHPATNSLTSRYRCAPYYGRAKVRY